MLGAAIPANNGALIYTVPAEPSRKRAAIWRELKKVGAPYLRDGVCILPERPATRERLDAIATRVGEFGGDATLVSGARLSETRASALVEQFRATRAEECGEIARETDRLLEHVACETEHRQFTYAELEELEGDLGKLRHWTDRVGAEGGTPRRGFSVRLPECPFELKFEH